MLSYLSQLNTHRQRRLDSTQQLRCVGVGGVYQVLGDEHAFDVLDIP